MSTTVRHTMETLPPLTPEREAELRVLAARPESEIDLSEIPEFSQDRWADAVRGGFHRPAKRQITARVDADVLDWLKSQGKGYQLRINAILRREMAASLESGSK